MLPEIELNKGTLPKHIAFASAGAEHYADTRGLLLSQALEKNESLLLELINLQAKLQLPITTILISPLTTDSVERITAYAEHAHSVLETLDESQILKKFGIKVNIFGKWYNLPSKTIDLIKKILQETSGHEELFLNLCINYDGQAELVDAIRIIGRKVAAGKLYPDAIDKGNVKEEIYTSYFLPPDIVIASGTEKQLGGFLLWDSAKAPFYFIGKDFPDCDISDIIEALKWLEEQKKHEHLKRNASSHHL